MRLLFLFLDGVGLGANDPQTNPFARAEMPHLLRLLDGQRMVQTADLPTESERASLTALDACLGVPGIPQSATGQAALLTGLNIAALVNGHDGPKPSPQVARFLHQNTLFTSLRDAGKIAALLNAFPPRYFASLESGYRLPGAIAMAVRAAGFPLKTQADLFAGQAISADLTAQGWRGHLGIPDTPLLTLEQAGLRLAHLACQVDFAIFEFWLSDVVGHRQDMPAAVTLLDTFDQMLGSLLAAWNDTDGMILLTSDHGNLEDLSTRRHTTNPVPLLLVGALKNRRAFLSRLQEEKPAGSIPDLSGVTPTILNLLWGLDNA